MHPKKALGCLRMACEPLPPVSARDTPRRPAGGLLEAFLAMPFSIPSRGMHGPFPVWLLYREHNGGRIMAWNGLPAQGVGRVTHRFTHRKGYAVPVGYP